MKVVIVRGSIADGKNCSVKRCKRKDKYLIFVPFSDTDVNTTALSRLRYSSCPHHLEKLVRRVLKEAEK